MSGAVSVRALSPSARLFGVALICLAAVGAALVAQYRFDMQPCPWCVLQRGIYLGIAVLCLLGALLPARPVKLGLAGAAALLALLGAASASWQHLVAAKSSSCNLTLADKILTALNAEALFPALFQVTANCADAAVSVLGIPFEYWSLALFALLAAAAASALVQLRQGA